MKTNRNPKNIDNQYAFDFINQNFPWHFDSFNQFVNLKKNGNFPSGLIIYGETGIGKTSFSKLIAKSLLCQNSPYACQKCADCELMDKNEHPSLLNIGLTKKSKQIKLHKEVGDEEPQILDLIQFLVFSETTAKVSVINPADTINLSASNALLKTLEELGKNKHIIFVTNQLHKLPATIISRSVLLHLRFIHNEQAQNWWLNQIKSTPNYSSEIQDELLIKQYQALLELNNHSIYKALEFRKKLNLVLDFWNHLAKLFNNEISAHQLSNLIANWDKQFLIYSFLGLIQICLYQKISQKQTGMQSQKQLIKNLFFNQNEESLKLIFDLINNLKGIDFEVISRFYNDAEKVSNLLQTTANQTLLFDNLFNIFNNIHLIKNINIYPDAFNYEQFSLKK